MVKGNAISARSGPVNRVVAEHTGVEMNNVTYFRERDLTVTTGVDGSTDQHGECSHER